MALPVKLFRYKQFNGNYGSHMMALTFNDLTIFYFNGSPFAVLVAGGKPIFKRSIYLSAERAAKTAIMKYLYGSDQTQWPHIATGLGARYYDEVRYRYRYQPNTPSNLREYAEELFRQECIKLGKKYVMENIKTYEGNKD